MLFTMETRQENPVNIFRVLFVSESVTTSLLNDVMGSPTLMQK